MTASLIAVFIPLLFMGGMIGRLFREFAVTVAVASCFGADRTDLVADDGGAVFEGPELQVRARPTYEWSERAFDRLFLGYARSLKLCCGLLLGDAP